MAVTLVKPKGGRVLLTCRELSSPLPTNRQGLPNLQSLPLFKKDWLKGCRAGNLLDIARGFYPTERKGGFRIIKMVIFLAIL